MKKIFLLFIIFFIRTNSQIKENPIFLVNTTNPFVLSTNDNYYYVITKGKSLKINKESGNIENITINDFTNSNYIYIVDNSYNNYIYYSNKYYHIIYEPFISYEEITIHSEQISGESNNMIVLGGIEKDNDFIVYGRSEIDSYLLFSKKSQQYSASIRIENINDKLSCKLIEEENYICVMITNDILNIFWLNYNIHPDEPLQDSLTTYNFKEFQNTILSLGLYDTGDSHVKLLCGVYNQSIITQCKFFEIENSYFFGDNNIVFNATKYFNEKNCSLSQFNNEYLFCCAIINFIECYRINTTTYFIIKKFQLLKITGYNSHLTIKSNNDYSTFFFMNTYYNRIIVYEYYIYLPNCQDRKYFILNSLNENRSKENYEKLRNLFTIEANNYFFEFKNDFDDLGYFTLNGSRIEQKTSISNNDYIFDFIVTNNNISHYLEKRVNYIVSVEEEAAYSKECQITLIFQACYHSCQKCSKIINDSNDKEHNCINCKQNFYQSPENNSNCYSIDEKKINWYLDSEESKFRFCDEGCLSCNGSTKYNCLSCNRGLYLDNHSCTFNCSEGYFPLRTETNSSYYFICNKCFQNCKTCSKGGDSQKMRCDSCKDNQIKYNDSCFDIFNSSIKSFIAPKDSGYNITSCYEKFGLYIKEDSNECIPLSTEYEGYYISNNETGLLSKCHENCFSCYNGPIFNNSGYIQSMECITCKDSNNSEKTMIKINNNCFKIIQYNESKIIFDISEMTTDTLGTCHYFGKVIYYGEYKCIDKPINTYYVLIENYDNTGIIKNCHEACKTCLGRGSQQNTNCIECALGYAKTKDSSTHCLKNNSISLDNYYFNKRDNIYYHCYQNCKGCYNSYNSSSKDMYCLDCINDYYFIFEENNCYNYSLLQENKYYFNINDSKFHKCYYTCSECSNFVPDEGNHFCLRCISGYYILENTNNCYNMNKTLEGYYLDKIFIVEKGPIFKKCYNSCKTCEQGIVFNSTTNKEIHNCKECADNYFTLENDLYPTNCYKYENNNFSEDLKSSNNIICLDYITPEGYCVLTCPNGTYHFSLNNSCLYSCPHNYEIENNKCLFKNFDLETSAEEFKTLIRNDIISYVNSSKVINGSNFIAVISTSDKINPEDQLKNGISAVDLGNCSNVIKEYYNMSNEESFIVLNMEFKNDDNQKNESYYDEDKSFDLGKNTQLEIYDNSGIKLNISVCKEDIKILKLLGDVEKHLDINLAKALANQGIDVFDKNDEFFNDICHQYENSYGKDIILTDRRNDIYQDATFCQYGCAYKGINYNLNYVNCMCGSNFLQEENITKYENDEKISNFKSLTKLFITSLLNLNFEILRCYNLALNMKILIHNIGFYCLSSMYVLQIIFFFVYLFKRLESLKNFMLTFCYKKIIKNNAKSTKPLKNKSIVNENNYKNKLNQKKKYIKSNYNKRQESRLKNKANIINDIHGQKKYKNKIIDNVSRNDKLKNSGNILNLSKFRKSESQKTFIININNNSKNITNFDKEINNDKIYKIKSNNRLFVNKGKKSSKNIHKFETLPEIINNENNKRDIINLSNSAIQDLDYEEAIIYDKRSFLRIYFGCLVDSQLILGTFCSNNNLDLFVIKLSFLVFTFQISFFMNSLFYTDEYISDAYHNDGVLDFFSGLPKCIYSFIATLIITNLLKMLSSSKDELIRVIKRNEKFNNYLKIINIKLVKLRKKLIIYFILVFILGAFFLYYVIVFCAVYKYSQKYWFLGCLQSFGIDFATALISCLFLSLLRYISIKKHIKCLYIFTNIISSFL